MTQPEDIIYSVNVEDLQTIAQEEWGRDLTDDEIEAIADKFGDYMGWYEAGLQAIEDVIGTVPGNDEYEEER